MHGNHWQPLTQVEWAVGHTSRPHVQAWPQWKLNLGCPRGRLPTALWVPECTVLLHLVDDYHRQAPTRTSEFGVELDRVLWSNLALAMGPAVELVK